MNPEDQFQIAIEALELIGSKSSCECWRVPGMGSGLPYVWIGCPAHLSADPEEWCLTCMANEALSKLHSMNLAAAGGKSVNRTPAKTETKTVVAEHRTKARH